MAIERAATLVMEVDKGFCKLVRIPDDRGIPNIKRCIYNVTCDVLYTHRRSHESKLIVVNEHQPSVAGRWMRVRRLTRRELTSVQNQDDLFMLVDWRTHTLLLMGAIIAVRSCGCRVSRESWFRRWSLS